MSLPGKVDWTEVDPAFAGWLEEYLRPIGRLTTESEQILYDAWKASRDHHAAQAAAARPGVEHDALVTGPEGAKALPAAPDESGVPHEEG